MPPQFAQLKQTQYICRNKVKRGMDMALLISGIVLMIIGIIMFVVMLLRKPKDNLALLYGWLIIFSCGIGFGFILESFNH